ncbi:MAG: DUF5060 domain-containing protein [Bryobacteraceae bacterium]
MPSLGFPRLSSTALLLVSSTLLFGEVNVSGELKRWHKVTLTFDGPEASEDGTPNPFFNYRLNVTFTHARSGHSHVVPGFYAADGNAAESSARAGNKWRAHFRPDEEGEWQYRASFRSGDKIAADTSANAGESASFDGAKGSFQIRASDKKGADLRSKGMLQYVGGHHLRFSGNGEYFLKGGADSPENFLAYADFDDTYDADADSGSYKKVGPFIHKYAPHVQDWRKGDPAWKNGKGKGIIGALNYLASKGVNSVYFLTYNIDGGDGRDTWMWTGVKVRDRYDVSKLDQWEIVFDHMDRRGIMLHVVTQETENDQALGGGPGLNPIRKLYYRELAARFAHHPALIWNLGEENDTPDPDRKKIAQFIRSIDPYRHPITVHTHANKELTFYDGILGDPAFEATSIQSSMPAYNRSAIALRRRSAEAGRKWAIFGDEQNPASHGVLPDETDPNHDEPRIHALWGNLLGGGSGVEWYFGHAFPHMDINCEDFRSRDRMWDQTRYALDFFREHVPFHEMEPNNDLVTGVKDGRVLAQGDKTFVVQIPAGGEASLKLGSGTYRVQWFNPREGGRLQTGSRQTLQGPGMKPLGHPPTDPEKDWIAMVTK